MLDSLVASIDWTVLTLTMPHELLSNDADVIDRDRAADISKLAAVDGWTAPQNSRFVPDGVRGRLASMVDARERPLDDPRLSTVRQQANMPLRR
jgi:hypothetical protein